MALDVRFLKGTSAGYDGLATKNADTFYYTTDDNNLYLGEIKLSNGVELAAAVDRIAENEKDILAIENQLKSLVGEGTGSIQDMINAAKTELETKIKAAQDAADAAQREVDALETVVADNKTAVEARVKAIEDDYLVEADKTELQGNIDALAGKVGEVAEGKTLAGLVSENAQAITTLKGEGEGSVKKAIDDAINKFATDVTDDAVINSYKELIDWVAEHGSEAAEMAEAIQTNKTDIAELEALVGTLPEGATVTTVVELIQSLVNAEKTRAEGIEGGLADRITDLETAVGEGGSVDSQIDAKIAELDATVASTDVEEGKGLKVTTVQTDGKLVSVAVEGNFNNSYDAKGAAATAEQNAKDYADGLAGDYDPAGSAAAAQANAAKDATTKANAAEANAKTYVDNALTWGSFEQVG